jgi:hypothetical protein
MAPPCKDWHQKDSQHTHKRRMAALFREDMRQEGNRGISEDINMEKDSGRSRCQNLQQQNCLGQRGRRCGYSHAERRLDDLVFADLGLALVCSNLCGEQPLQLRHGGIDDVLVTAPNPLLCWRKDKLQHGHCVAGILLQHNKSCYSNASIAPVTVLRSSCENCPQYV